MKKVIKFASKGVQLGKGRPSKSSKKLLQRMGKEKASAEKWNNPDYTLGPTMSNYQAVTGVKRKKTRAQLRKDEIVQSLNFALRESYLYSRELRGL